MIKRKPPNEKQVSNQLAKMTKSLDDIERIWLNDGRNKYIAGGGKISVADIQACCELEQPSLAG